MEHEASRLLSTPSSLPISEGFLSTSNELLFMMVLGERQRKVLFLVTKKALGCFWLPELYIIISNFNPLKSDRFEKKLRERNVAFICLSYGPRKAWGFIWHKFQLTREGCRWKSGSKVLGREESSYLLDCFLFLDYGEPFTVDWVFGIFARASSETQLISLCSAPWWVQRKKIPGVGKVTVHPAADVGNIQ